MDVAESFPPVPESTRAARHFVAGAAAGADDAVSEAVILLTSELVTNAILHARTDVKVTVCCLGDGTVRVEVWDDNVRMPQPCLPSPGATTGRGLGIVDSLASAWGAERQGQGKIVWFEVSPARLRSRISQ